MKKKIFTLMTLALMSIGSAWAAEICSAQVPNSDPWVGTNTTGIDQTGCTLMWSGLQAGSNIVTVSDVAYFKIGSNSAYVQLKLTSGSFQAGDALKATVTSNGGDSKKEVNLKVKESATGTVKVNSNETDVIEYTLKDGDIEEDGSIKIYRADKGASNIRVAIFSVSRATETYTVTFDAGDKGICATASLTEESVGAGVTLPDVTAISGYGFMGWFTAADGDNKAGDAGDTYYPTSDIKLYAHYFGKITGSDNTYYVEAGDEITSGTQVVCDDITMEYSTADYKAATANNLISNINGKYVASVTTDTNAWGVTFTPSSDGVLSVGVVINGGKLFSIINASWFNYNGNQDNGTDSEGVIQTIPSAGSIPSNEWKPAKKQYTIITIPVTAGTNYKFSVAGSKMAFYGFEFTKYADATALAAVGSTGWATYVAPTDLDFAGITDVKAYIVTGHTDSAIDVEQMTGTVPAGTPLLLEGVTTDVPVVAGSSNTDVSANLLKAGTGADSAAESGKTKYALSVADDKATFKKISSATIPVGKAYLEFAETIDAPSLSFGGTTGIMSVDNGQLTVDSSEVYNLNGQRVAQPTKGLYIVNGKKVIIK